MWKITISIEGIKCLGIEEIRIKMENVEMVSFVVWISCDFIFC